MAGEITWRTLIGPSLADAAAPMRDARASFNDGFGVFDKTLGKYNARLQERDDEAQEGMVLDYRTALQGARTPEEAEALKARLGAMTAGMNNKSRAAVLPLFDERIKDARASVSAGQQYDAAQLNFTNRKEIDAIAAAAAQGDPSAVARANALGEQGVPIAPLIEKYVAGSRAKTTFVQQGEEHARKREKLDLEIRSHDENMRLKQQELDVRRQSAKTDAERVRLQGEQNMLTQQGNKFAKYLQAHKAGTDATDAIAKEESSYAGNKAGNDGILKAVSDAIKDKDALKKVTPFLSAAINDPKNSDVPANVFVDMAIQSARPATGGFWGMGKTPAPSFDSLNAAYLSSTEHAERVKSKLATLGQLRNRAQVSLAVAEDLNPYKPQIDAALAKRAKQGKGGDDQAEPVTVGADHEVGTEYVLPKSASQSSENPTQSTDKQAAKAHADDLRIQYERAMIEAGKQGGYSPEVAKILRARDKEQLGSVVSDLARGAASGLESMVATARDITVFPSNAYRNFDTASARILNGLGVPNNYDGTRDVPVSLRPFSDMLKRRGTEESTKVNLEALEKAWKKAQEEAK
jgi:hypothetical protein